MRTDADVYAEWSWRSGLAASGAELAALLGPRGKVTPGAVCQIMIGQNLVLERGTLGGRLASR